MTSESEELHRQERRGCRAQRSPMRIYLRTSPDSYASFVLFDEFNPHELLFTVYGLERKAPTLTVRYPDQEVSDAELPYLEWLYSNGQPMSIPADHFTCHRDGTFHLKKRRFPGSVYSDILRCDHSTDYNTSRFLDVVLLSDRAAEYRCLTSKPRRPRIEIETGPEEVVFIRARFSGVDYDLESEVEKETRRLIGNPNIIPAHSIQWATIKGVMTIQRERFPPDVFQHRPRGTVVAVRFNVGSDRHLLRAYGFA